VIQKSAVEHRAGLHAALGDPVRLAIVDELMVSDRAPTELQALTRLESNLLAHHLDTLEVAGLIVRSHSSGDARRRYVRLVHGALGGLEFAVHEAPSNVLFVCTKNSARSQLAAALWREITGQEAQSAGTHPAQRVHPGAIAAAERSGLDLHDAIPRRFEDVAVMPSLVITVCDRAHEEIGSGRDWWHWSVPDPLQRATKRAFDATIADLRDRIEAVFETREVLQ
jgi:protein-tyrosine-phosphatase